MAGLSTTIGPAAAPPSSPGRPPGAANGRPQGVFHLDCNSPGSQPSQKTLRYWEAGTGQDRPVATLLGGWVAGVSASPDGRTIIWGRSTLDSDLMMIENFR
ncbi:MAG TPA: hypothetical protein VMT70_01160 [Vicinamibacteria bacterium]|nr:hypothetical protein [Vicinamibacteria bacterium]